MAKDYFDKNEEKFSEICLSYILDFPSVLLPTQLKKDRFRYESGDRKAPSRKKLNKTFEYLKIPFEIEKKRFYGSINITKWRLIRK